MEELLRTSDLVTISLVESLLREAGIEALTVDGNMNVTMPFGMLPRRILVPEDLVEEAREIVAGAGLGQELK